VDYALVGFGQQDTARAIRPVDSGNLPAGYCWSAAVAGGRGSGDGRRGRRDSVLDSDRPTEGSSGTGARFDLLIQGKGEVDGRISGGRDAAGRRPEWTRAGDRARSLNRDRGTGEEKERLARWGLDRFGPVAFFCNNL
jgi:hypothetical protein